MSFEQEIRNRLNAGEDWTTIATSFTDNLNSIRKEKLASQNQVENIKKAIVEYYGDSPIGNAIDKMNNEDVKKILDGFKELYDSIDNLTFPLKIF